MLCMGPAAQTCFCKPRSFPYAAKNDWKDTWLVTRKSTFQNGLSDLLQHWKRMKQWGFIVTIRWQWIRHQKLIVIINQKLMACWHLWLVGKSFKVGLGKCIQAGTPWWLVYEAGTVAINAQWAISVQQALFWCICCTFHISMYNGDNTAGPVWCVLIIPGLHPYHCQDKQCNSSVTEIARNRYETKTWQMLFYATGSWFPKHKISEKGLQPSKQTVQAIVKAPAPSYIRKWLSSNHS